MTPEQIASYKAFQERMKATPPRAEFIPPSTPPPPRPKREPFKCRRCGKINHPGKCNPKDRRAHLGLPEPSPAPTPPAAKEVEIDKPYEKPFEKPIVLTPNDSVCGFLFETPPDPELAAIDAILRATSSLSRVQILRVLSYVESRSEGD